MLREYLEDIAKTYKAGDATEELQKEIDKLYPKADPVSRAG